MGTMKNTLVHMANGLHPIGTIITENDKQTGAETDEKNRTVLYKQGTFLVTV